MKKNKVTPFRGYKSGYIRPKEKKAFCLWEHEGLALLFLFIFTAVVFSLALYVILEIVERVTL